MPPMNTPRPVPANPPASSDDAQVDAAERKLGSVLEALESDTGGEVRDVDLEEVVDTDSAGRPVLKKKVDIDMVRRREKPWVR